MPIDLTRLPEKFWRTKEPGITIGEAKIGQTETNLLLNVTIQPERLHLNALEKLVTVIGAGQIINKVIINLCRRAEQTEHVINRNPFTGSPPNACRKSQAFVSVAFTAAKSGTDDRNTFIVKMGRAHGIIHTFITTLHGQQLTDSPKTTAGDL